jgi:hypothetical protein
MIYVEEEISDNENENDEVKKIKLENLKYGEEIMEAIDVAEKLRENYVAYED